MSCLGLSAASASHRRQLHHDEYIHTGPKMTHVHLFSLRFFQNRRNQSNITQLKTSHHPSTTPCVFSTRSNPHMYNLSKADLNMSLDLFNAYRFLALSPLSLDEKPFSFRTSLGFC